MADTAGVDTSEVFLAYGTSSGDILYREISEFLGAGDAVDDDTDETADLIGWSRVRRGIVETGPMYLVYQLEDGDRAYQSWKDTPSGNLQNPEPCDEENADLIGWTEALP